MENNNKGGNKLLVFGALATVTAFVIYAIYSISDNVKKLKSLTAKFDSVEFLGFDLGEKKLGLKINLLLQNTSAFKIIAKGYKLDVFLNGTFITPVVYKDQQTISANSTSPISFNLYFSPFQIVKDFSIEKALNALKNIRGIKIKITGYISASVDGVNIENLPVSIETLLGDLIKSE
jgi:hypothetical protein